MSIGLLFWVLMIIWFVFGFFRDNVGPYGMIGHTTLLFILLFLLGWHSFGFVIHQ